MPGWMQTVASYNPLNWAVEAGRDAVTVSPDWGSIAGKTGLLVAFLLLCGELRYAGFPDLPALGLAAVRSE